MVRKKREDVTGMRKCIKVSLLSSVRCLFSCCCVVAVAGAVFTPSARAASPDGSAAVDGKKFCVIVRPAAPGKRPVDARPLLQDGRPSPSQADNPLVSFFKGQVKKIGFGVPKSFSVTQVNPAAMPERAVSGRQSASLGYGEEDRGDSRCLFPSLGYYSRFSQNGTQAVAVGFGLRGPDPADIEAELPTTPEASVAVMVGFAF
jgi:hypothetical protein